MNARFGAVLSGALLLAACGGGGGGSTGGGSTGGGSTGPMLTLVSITPAAAYSGNNPGTVTVAGVVTVSGANASALKVSLVNGSGSAVAGASASITGAPSPGEVSFSASIGTATLPAGMYQLEVQATSSSGGISNTVSQPFNLIAYPWSSATPMPSSVSEFAIAAVGTKIYLLTGLSTVNGVGTATSQVQIFDSASGLWSTGPQAPTPRAGSVAATVGGKIYIIGGYNSSNPGGITAVDIFDPTSATWASGSPEPTARLFACAGVIGSSIYVASGTQSQTDTPALDSLESLDASMGTWSTLAQDGYFVAHPACAVLNGILYLTGGNSSANGASESVGAKSYDPRINVWSGLNFFSINRTRHAAVSVGGQIVIMGGLSDAGGITASTNVTEAFTPSSNSWQTKAAMPVAAQDVNAVQINGVVYVFSPISTYVYQALTDTL